MLEMLSGRRHEVVSGIAVCSAAEHVVESAIEVTSVWIRQLCEDDISWYLRTAEHEGKAGSYGIQGAASVFVERIEGDYSNVVGLPLAGPGQVDEPIWTVPYWFCCLMNVPISDLFSGRWMVRRAIILFVGMLSLYYFAPDILELINSAPELVQINRRWFFLMIVFEVISFGFLWWLTRIVLPNVSWFVASTSQLASNAASRIIPGGAAVGGAVLFRMLAVSGTSSGQAGAALAATSGLSTTALAAFPAAGVALAVAGAPIPESLVPAVLAGGVLFPLLVCVGVVSVRTTRPLLRLGIVVSKLVSWSARILRQSWRTDPRNLVLERDRMVAAIADRWLLAVVAAALNWVFDYLVLVTALVAVGADPRLSLVLLAYTGGALLTMIPVTPGGFGFVETGMTYLLVLSGITKGDALLATLAYRIVSLWLPILAGSVAWVVFHRRYGSADVDVTKAVRSPQDS